MVLKEVAKEIFLEVLGEIDVARAFQRKVRREGSKLHIGGSGAATSWRATQRSGTSGPPRCNLE